MPKLTEEGDLIRICVRLRKDDYTKLQAVSTEFGGLGTNQLIRSIVHSYIVQLTRRENEAYDNLAAGD